jgi:phage-related baseplate assembly protein
MSLFTFDDVTTPETPASVSESIYDALAALGVRTAGWKPGGVARAIITGVSHVFAAWSQWSVQIAKMGWLETSERSWLTLVAKYDYGVDRRVATFASGTVTIDNAGGGIYAFDPGDLIVTSTDGRAYRNTAAVSIDALETGVDCAVAAVESGAASTALPGQIDGFETPYTGLTVTNTLSIVGTDEETDAALKIRCRDAAIAASPLGPRDAYSFFAQRATRDDGTEIGITRVRATSNSETGDVAVTVATASGALSAPDLAAAELYLYEHAAPLAVTLTVLNGVDHVVPITYRAWFRSSTGATPTDVAADIEASLAAFFAERPIGGDIIPPSAVGYVYLDGLCAAIGAARPEIVHFSVTIPSGNTAIAANGIPTLGTVTGTCTAITG